MSHATLLLILALVQVPKPVDPVTRPQDRGQDPDKQVEFKFKDAPIEDVISYVAKNTGFVIKDEAKVSGKITAWSEATIPVSHVLAFLDSCLAPNHALVKLGSEVKILRFEEAKRRTLDVRVSMTPEEVPNTEQVMTIIYPLKNLNVVEVNKELDDLYPKNATVLINTYSNTLIMTGRADEIHKVMLVLTKLDVEAKEKLDIRVVSLKNADATETAKLVNDLLIKEAEEERTNPFARMFGMMQNAGGGGVKAKEVASEIIRVAADIRTNSIIVASTKANIELIVKIIMELDTVSSSVKVALYPLKYADAETVAQLIADMFQQTRGPNQQGQNQQRRQEWWMRGGQPQAQAQESATSGDVKAVADLRTNTVVVTAARKVHESIIQPLVDELDKKTADFQAFKYFRLKYADAYDVASQVKSMFDTSLTSSGTAGTANRTAGRTGGGTAGQQGGTTGSTPTRAVGQSPNQKVYVAADEIQNGLMVRASAVQMEQIEAIIKELDTERPDMGIFVYRAKNIDPARLQQALAGLSGTTTTGQQGQQGQQQQAWGNPFSTYRTAGQSGQMNSSQQQNPSNNFGRTSGAGGGSSRSGGSMGGFRPLGPFQDEGGTAPPPLQEPDPLLQEPPTGGVRGAMSSQYNPETGDVIIRTSERNRARVMALLEQLDRPRPQVLIKCRIVDVTTDDALALGTEGSFTSGRFTYSTDFAEFNPQRIGDGAFAINTNNIEDVTMRLQTLAREGRARILATPSIMVLDNEIADISIGSRVPFIDTVNQTPQGGTQNSIVYQSIGIILRVQPHINPEGRVTMAVNPVVSDVDESRSIPITEGVTSPTFTENTATTMVTIRNGNTVVIGGLIREVEDQVVQKVPFLGDIPLINLAFSRRDTVKSKRELMIFLTPYVVFSEEQLSELSELEKAGVKLINRHEMPVEGRRWRSYMKTLGGKP